jgi:hypothetical protein
MPGCEGRELQAPACRSQGARVDLFDPSAMLALLQRHRAEGAWSVALLNDLQRMIGHPSWPELK